MLLEHKNAVIYGGGGFIGGAIARTEVTGEAFPSYMTLACMTTQHQGKAA